MAHLPQEAQGKRAIEVEERLQESLGDHGEQEAAAGQAGRDEEHSALHEAQQYLERHVDEEGQGVAAHEGQEEPRGIRAAERVAELQREHGFEAVPDDGHQRVPCDVYAPCARGAGINDDTIPMLRCKAVAGCANNILLEPYHADDLKSRGIVYAPDYVINAGGIINVGMELVPGGSVEANALAKIEGISDNLKRVFAIARERSVSTRDAAAFLAESRRAAGRRR